MLFHELRNLNFGWNYFGLCIQSDERNCGMIVNSGCWKTFIVCFQDHLISVLVAFP